MNLRLLQGVCQLRELREIENLEKTQGELRDKIIFGNLRELSGNLQLLTSSHEKCISMKKYLNIFLIFRLIQKKPLRMSWSTYFDGKTCIQRLVVMWHRQKKR